MRLPCRRPIRREVESEQSSFDSDQEASRPDNLKKSSDYEETKPLMAANKHPSSYGGHGSITSHAHGSFVSSVNSMDGEDFNNIYLISPTHTIN